MAISNEQLKVFFDTSFWVALYYEKDPHFNQAFEIHKKITSAVQIYINNLVVYEALTVLAFRGGRQLAINFGEYVFQGIGQGVILSSIVDEPRERQAWNVFRAINKKDVSFVDCSILQTIKEFDIDVLLTFDKHFNDFQKDLRFKVNEI